MIKTVLGDIKETELGIVLSHEHICCYSDYLYSMAEDKYLNKRELLDVSVKYLKELKSKYGLNTFVDCTPVNIGRDVELLKEISRKTGVNIICSTGFYYTEEPLLNSLSETAIAEYIIEDAKRSNAGIIKCAVENENITEFDKKILKATAKAQLQLNLPIVLHTNANNKNGLKALEILLKEEVRPEAITIGHLSDTDDSKYIRLIAKIGCYIGFDRLYANKTEEYIDNKIKKIDELLSLGYGDKILLSHDALFFNGFEAEPKINEKPRFNYVFDYIIPQLQKDVSEYIMKSNPKKFLKCGD